MADDQVEATCPEFAEYDRLAIALDISLSERCDILNVTALHYRQLRTGAGLAPSPELARRLRYAMRIMRRSLANQAPPPNYVFSERRL